MFGRIFSRPQPPKDRVLQVDPASAAGQVYSLAAQVASLRADSKSPKAVGMVNVANSSNMQRLSVDFAIALTRFIDGPVLLVHPNTGSGRKNAENSLQTHELFGWTEIVDGRCNYQDVVRQTSIDRLSILNFGMPKRSSRSATSAAEKDITTQSISTTLKVLKQDYEFIVFQLPSVVQDVTALSLASVLDGVIVVIEHRATRMSQIKSYVEFLQNHNVHVVGAVMNRYRSFLPSFLRRK